jgi:subtilisin family serine protease
MKPRNLLFVILAVALGCSGTALSQLGQVSLEPVDLGVRPNEVIVELRPGASISAVNSRHHTSTISNLYGTNFYLLRVPSSTTAGKCRNRLAVDPDVLSASLNPEIANPSVLSRSTVSFPDGFATPGLTVQDFQSQIEFFTSLQLNDVLLRSRGAGVVVAVVDTGVDIYHPFVANRLWTNPDEQPDGLDNDGNGLVDDIHGWNFSGEQSNGNVHEYPGDPKTTVAGHGTFIAALIATLAPDCRIMPVKAFPPDGMTEAFTVASAVKYAADSGAHVINLSLGSSDPNDLLDAAIRDARSRGIAVVAAAGNDGSESDPQFPSLLAEVVAVGAIETTGIKAYFSNFGTHLDLCAPGAELVSAFPWPGDQYALWSGTSFAAPLVAAEAVLVRSADPRHPDLKKVIEDTAISIDNLNPELSGKLGRGRINPLGALKAVGAGEARPASDRLYQVDLVRNTPRGQGRVTAKVSGETQQFFVEVYNVTPRALYSLFVDGVLVAANQPASNLGSVQFPFSSDAADLPAPISPVTKARQIEVRSGGVPVMVSAFSSDTAPVAGFVEREAKIVGAPSGLASGMASITAEAVAGGTQRETLLVSAENLNPNSFYKLAINGVPISGFVQAASGCLRLVFTSDGSRGILLPSELRITNIEGIELRNAHGHAVLGGMFVATAQPLP